jgi:hypothetical protein
MTPAPRIDPPYRKLFGGRNWEVPVPSRETVIGFLAVLAVSLALHGLVLWLCALLRG